MATSRYLLSFNPELVNEPITYRMVKDFDLMINILRAEIDDLVRKAGRSLLSGSPSDLDECVLALETLLGELSAVGYGWKEGYGGA